MSSNTRHHTEVEEDRISKLPDDLILRIFAYLDDIEEVIQTSLISRRWRYLWHSNPYLYISYPLRAGNNRPNLAFQEFIAFVDQVLLSGNGFQLQKFSLVCHFANSPEELHMWITSSIARNVQTVELDTVEIAEDTLNDLVKQVKSLKLCMVGVNLVDPGEELILSCTALERLVVDVCNYHCQRVSIYAPNLKSLNVHDTVMNGDDDDGIQFKICAPNMTVLKIEDNIFVEYLMESLPVLDSAEIELLEFEENEMLARYLKNTLKGLAHAKRLTLSAEPFQVFSRVPIEFQAMGISFQNTRYLKLKKWSNTAYICAVGKLLANLPNVEALVLEREKWALPSQYGGDWKEQLSKCMLCHLKSIEIQDPEGTPNELKFLRFLLENAPELEVILVSTTEPVARVRETMDNFMVGLKLIAKVTSRPHVNIVFKIQESL